VRRRDAIAVAGIATAFALGAGCRSREVATWPDAPVVLISVDTLRADHLALYGYRRGSTPHLDALGREGVVFESAYSHCPLTLPSHASMLTGLLPPRHGVRDNSGFALGPDIPTLATRFHERGYATGAAVSAFVLRAATGIARGFDRYDDAIETDAAVEDMGEQERDGAVAVRSLLEWVDGVRERPFFTFLHLYEPHTPYAPPSPWAERFPSSPYDGEVAYADELVGRFLEGLRARGLLDRTIVAFASDHGEALGDHGEREHGFFLYRETVRVPLVLRLPGGARGGTRVAATVGLVDLPATLLDLASVPAQGLDGVSLRAAMTGHAPSRPVYSETFLPRYHFGWSGLVAMTDDRYRYIRAPRPELYDLSTDPGETKNLAGERPAAVAEREEWLSARSGGEAPAPAPVDPETRERLEALGYVGGDTGPAPVGPRADPKDKIATWEAYKEALALRREGRSGPAVAALRAVLADNPAMRDAWEALGRTLAGMGREREALAALETAVRLAPERASAHLALARVHALAGDTDQAARHAQAAAATQPGEGYELLAEIRLGQGRPDEAASLARRSVSADPRRATSHFVLAVVARRAGRCGEALEEYRRAAEAQRLQKRLVIPGLHAGMADCLARTGDEAAAEREFRAEIDEVPRSREGRVGLAMLYRAQGRDAEARRVLEGVVSANPHAGAEEYWTVVRTFQVLGDAEAAREWARRGRTRFPRDTRFR
jgi:choline-sulfatase